MKKNLLTIIILALQIVQVAMLGFILLSVMSTNNRTAALISDIAGALELESVGGTGGGTQAGAAVSLADTETYSISGDDKLTVPLRIDNSESGDGKQHYAQVEVTLSINNKHDDYATYGTAEQLDAFKERIRNTIMGVIEQYTIEQVQDVTFRDTEIKTAVLNALQNLYEGSDFIYRIDWSVIPS